MFVITDFLNFNCSFIILSLFFHLDVSHTHPGGFPYPHKVVFITVPTHLFPCLFSCKISEASVNCCVLIILLLH